jgi:type IV pilus assembly protein PilX
MPQPHLASTLAARTARAPAARQRGAILIVSMLLLLVLTILALATMRASTSQERMAGNVRDVGLSFQSTESAVRAAEERINALDEYPNRCTDVAACDPATEVYALGVLPDVRLEDEDWWADRGLEYGVAGEQEIERVTDDPTFVVEAMGFDRDSLDPNEPEGRWVYRIYGRGTGGTDVAQSVVESTFTRRF